LLFSEFNIDSMPEVPSVTDAIYRRHAPGVFRRARRLLGNDADAHEVVQELFLSLLASPERFRGHSTLTTFLYTATTNACLNRIRDDSNRLRILAENPMGIGPRNSPLSLEQLTYLHELLNGLPEPLGRVAVHYYVDDLTHEQIARLLDCSPRHVGDLVERIASWAKSREDEPC
jgi:RNA polymerase sigma-70 factor (ECF subfamily)